MDNKGFAGSFCGGEPSLDLDEDMVEEKKKGKLMKEYEIWKKGSQYVISVLRI